MAASAVARSRSPSRALLAFAFAAATTAGCTGLGSVANEFTQALDPAQGAGAVIVLEHGEIVALRAPVSAGAVPAGVWRTADAVHPGGELVSTAREWGPHGDGWRVVKAYPVEGGGKQLRTVLVEEASGRVLERSHDLASRDAPAAVLEQAARLQRGTIQRVEDVQGKPGDEVFRVHLLAGDGRRSMVQSEVDGTEMRVWRVVSAELRIAE